MRRLVWIPVVAPAERARSVRDCLKLWNADEAIGSTHQVSHTVAARGRAPFSVPERRNLKSGERVVYNGRALRDGRIELTG